MNTTGSPIRSGLDFLRHVGFWVLVPVAIYVVYVLVDVTLWPDRDHLPRLVARLPFVVGQIIPVSVFVATSGRSYLFLVGDGARSRVHLWIWVAALAGAAYTVLALVDPLLAPLTGSDALFPRSLDRAADAAREAARITTGPESEAHMSVAGGYLLQRVVPFTTAAMVFVAAALGSLVNLGIPGARHGDLAAEFGGVGAMFAGAVAGLRSVAAGIFSGACWGPLPIADDVAGNLDLSAAGLFGLILAIHLALPLLIAAVAAVSNWRSDR